MPLTFGSCCTFGGPDEHDGNAATGSLLEIYFGLVVAAAMKAVRSAALAGPALPVGVIDWPGVASSLWRRHSVAWSPQLCQVRRWTSD